MMGFFLSADLTFEKLDFVVEQSADLTFGKLNFVVCSKWDLWKNKCIYLTHMSLLCESHVICSKRAKKCILRQLLNKLSNAYTSILKCVSIVLSYNMLMCFDIKINYLKFCYYVLHQYY